MKLTSKRDRKNTTRYGSAQEADVPDQIRSLLNFYWHQEVDWENCLDQTDSTGIILVQARR